MDAHQRVRGHLLESAEVKLRAASLCAGDVVRAASLIARAFATGRKLLLCGNGGSAADCQHLAAELVSRLSAGFVRPALPAIALTTDTSILTAYANDCGFEGVFARQVEGLGRPGDVLLGISTSGRSPNVLLAARRASAMGMRVVALIGSGGPLAEAADVTISVPSDDTQLIQECHLALEHVLCALVEQELYANARRPTVERPILQPEVQP